MAWRFAHRPPLECLEPWGGSRNSSCSESQCTPPTLLGENRSIPTFFPSLDFFILDEGQAEFNIWGFMRVSSTPSSVATQHVTLYHLFILEVSFGTPKLFLKPGELSSHLGLILEDGGHQPKKEARLHRSWLNLAKRRHFLLFPESWKPCHNQSWPLLTATWPWKFPAKMWRGQNFQNALERLGVWRVGKFGKTLVASPRVKVWICFFWWDSWRWVFEDNFEIGMSHLLGNNNNFCRSVTTQNPLCESSQFHWRTGDSWRSCSLDLFRMLSM